MNLRTLSSCWLAVCAGIANPAVAGDATTFAKWSPIEISLGGPQSRGEGDPNPFAIRLDVTFTGPSGQSYTVPGFYDGDGNGGLDGDVWKARFSADEVGDWTYRTSSPSSELDGETGEFTVTDIPTDAEGFYRSGRLEAVGTPENGIRYLKFRDGPYWLKAGCDDPENFLGNFRNYDTNAERKAAIDYLAERGVNSFYIMTHTLEGDHNDVWPWLGDDPTTAKSNGGNDARFDVRRLAEWLDVFEHMQRRGVACYLVLEDDSSWTGYDHERYYRELIARFGHLPALLFNFGEEHNERNSLSEAISWMETLERIDPYDHPCGVHNVNNPSDSYIDAEAIDFTAVQTNGSDPLRHNRRTRAWIEACESRDKRILMVGFDEPRPELDRSGWWSAYLAGGVWEVHTTQPYDRPPSAWEPAWTQLGGARHFLETLPFWTMNAANELVKNGDAFCLARPGEAYAVYLYDGRDVEVELVEGVEYRFDWWKATNGRDGRFQDGGTIGGGRQQFTAPGTGDWALRIVKDDGSASSRRIPGDCTGDDILDVSDAVCLLGFLFLGDPTRLPCGDGAVSDPGNLALLDWQPDGDLDIADAVALLFFLFLGERAHHLAAPVEPGVTPVEVECP